MRVMVKSRGGPARLPRLAHNGASRLIANCAEQNFRHCLASDLKLDEAQAHSLGCVGYVRLRSRMAYSGWHSMIGGEETVIWGVIIMIAGALGAFATFLLA